MFRFSASFRVPFPPAYLVAPIRPVPSVFRAPDIRVVRLFNSNEINTKEKKIAHLWPKQVKMTHLDSFGFAVLAAVTFFHPALGNRCLSSYINS